MESLFPYVPLCLSFAVRVNVLEQSTCQIFSHILMVLKMFLFFMWLFDDFRRKFISFRAIGRTVCQQKYSFVHRKRIFLYKTVVRSLPFANTRVVPRRRGPPRKPLAD